MNIDTIIKVVNILLQIIEMQAAAVKELFFVLAQHISVEEAEQLSVKAKIDEIDRLCADLGIDEPAE